MNKLYVFTLSSIISTCFYTEVFASVEVEVGGNVDLSASHSSQSSDYDGKYLYDDDYTNSSTVGTENKNSKTAIFSDESEFYIDIEKVASSGLKYGANASLEASSTKEYDGDKTHLKKAYLYSESNYGKFEFGKSTGASHKMKLGAETFARGAGGINGKYLEYINLPMIVDPTYSNSGNTYIADYNEVSRPPRFILIPQHPLDHSGYAKGFYDDVNDPDIIAYCNQAVHASDTNNNNSIDTSGELRCYDQEKMDKSIDFEENSYATKASYYTPRINGFQLGISYIPDSGEIGSASSATANTSGHVKNVVDAGLSYSETFGSVGFSASVTGQRGSFEEYGNDSDNRSDLKSFEYGFNISYLGFIIGGSYGEWANSLYEKKDATGSYDALYNGSKPEEASYYTAGLAYEFGKFGASGTYFSSQFQNNKFKAFSLGADYKIRQGIKPYIELTKFEFDSVQPATDINLSDDSKRLRDNEGTVGIFGVLISF